MFTPWRRSRLRRTSDVIATETSTVQHGRRHFQTMQHVCSARRPLPRNCGVKAHRAPATCPKRIWKFRVETERKRELRCTSPAQTTPTSPWSQGRWDVSGSFCRVGVSTMLEQWAASGEPRTCGPRFLKIERENSTDIRRFFSVRFLISPPLPSPLLLHCHSTPKHPSHTASQAPRVLATPFFKFFSNFF